MDIIPHLLLAIGHGVIVVWMVRLWGMKRAPGDLLIATICGTIAYDNIITIIARLTGADALLETMMDLRWAMHSIFTPFMMIVIMEISAAAGNEFVRKPAARAAVWATVLLFSTHGVIVDLLRIDLGLPAADLLSVGVAAHLDTLITEALILVLGVDLWRRQRWPWMFIGGMAMLIAAITRPVVLGMNLGSDGAIILMVAFAFSAARFAESEYLETDARYDTVGSAVN